MARPRNSSLGLKMGVILGVISIVVHYTAALCLHRQAVVGWGLLMGGLMMASTILYGVTGIRFANRAAGTVTFREVFSAILLAILISTALSFSWSIIYMKFIDASYAADYQQSRIAVLKMMHKTPQELNEEITAMYAAGKSSISFMAQAIFFGELILAKAVVGAITTLLLLRTPKQST